MSIEDTIKELQGDPKEADESLPPPVNWSDPDNNSDSFETLMGQIDAAEKAQVEADEKANEVPDEAEAEAKKEEEAEAPAASAVEAAEEVEVEEAPAAPDLSVIQQALPDRVIETPEDAQKALTDLRESADVLQRFEALTADDEALMTYLKLRTENKPARLAAIEAFGALSQVPDIDEDPEGYAEYIASQKEKAVRSEYEKKEADKQHASLQQRAQEAQRVFDATVQRLGLSEEDQTRLATTYSLMVQGDPQTGKFRSDTFENLWNAISGGNVRGEVDAVAEQIEKGDVAYLQPKDADSETTKKLKAIARSAYAKGVKSVKEKASKIASPPDVSSSRRDPSSDDPASQDMRRFASETLKQNHWWDNIPQQ